MCMPKAFGGLQLACSVCLKLGGCGLCYQASGARARGLGIASLREVSQSRQAPPQMRSSTDTTCDAAAFLQGVLAPSWLLRACLAHSLKFRCEAQDSLPDPDTLWQPWRLESLGINSLCVFPQTLSAKHEHPQKKKRKTPNGPRHPGSKHTWELHKVPRMPALFGGCGELSKSE